MSAPAEQGATHSLPGPPSQDVINLAGADIALSAVFLFLSGWIAWKHGKQGMVAWPIFASCFVARLVGAIYQIVTKNKPEIPSAVSAFIGSAVLACVSLTIFGVVYECNIILPTPPKRKREKFLLGFLHLTNTCGLCIGMYGGSPTDQGVINAVMNKCGNLLMLLCLVLTYLWMIPTYHKIQRYADLGHPNATPARHMFWATFFAMPYWAVRLAYGAVYAFRHDTASLDPVMGTFETKFVLVFGTWLLASLALSVGGWLGMRKVPRGPADALQLSFADPEAALRAERRRALGEMRREHQRWQSEVPVGAGESDAEMSTMLVEPEDGKPGKEKHKLQTMRRMFS